MEIEFKRITDFPRGTLATLLKDGYSFEPKFERNWHDQWQEFDDFFYDNPHIADFSGFMTVLEGKPIGFVSWNPTNLAESTEIGHNCILTKYKGKRLWKTTDAGGRPTHYCARGPKDSRLDESGLRSCAAYL